MVSIEKQFEVACQLARENEHARVAFVCSHFMFHELGRVSLISDPLFRVQVSEMVFPSGGIVKWVSPNEEEVVSRYCGAMFTSVFFTTGTAISPPTREYIRSRLRSANYPGPLKTYYPFGFAVWEESEQYGS